MKMIPGSFTYWVSMFDVCEQQRFGPHERERLPEYYTHSTIALLQFTPILQLHSHSLHIYNYTPTVYTYTITLQQFTSILQLRSHSLHVLYNYTPTVYILFYNYTPTV